MRTMKDSGLSWVGEIPSDWVAHPVYYYFGERKNKNIFGQEDNLLSLSYGRVIRKDINTNGGLLPESFNTYNIVEAGDIIIRPTDLQNDKKSLRTGLCLERGIITSAYIALRPIRRLNSGFFRYLLHAYDISKVFYNMGNGVRQGLNFSEFSRLTVFEPPIEIQDKVTQYLDTATAEVDKIISDIQTQIDTLEQYKRSVITETVTKGLNPNAEMKDSGIQWIGDMPVHWNVIRGKYILHYMQKPVREDDGVITCFRDGEVTLRSNRREGGFTMSDKEIGYQGIDVDDLVIHGMDGFAGAIGISDSRGKASPVLNVLDSSQQFSALGRHRITVAPGGGFVRKGAHHGGEGFRVAFAEQLLFLPAGVLVLHITDNVSEDTVAAEAEIGQQIVYIFKLRQPLLQETLPCILVHEVPGLFPHGLP